MHVTWIPVAVVVTGVAVLTSEATGQASPSAAPVATATTTAVGTTSTNLYSGLHGGLQPTVATWVSQQALVERARAATDVAALERAIQSRFGLHATHDQAAIDALGFLVLTEAVAGSDRDLQAASARAQSAATVTAALRQLLADVAQQTTSFGNAPADTPCSSALCRTLSTRLAGVAAAARQAGVVLSTSATGPLTAGRLRQIHAQLGTDLATMSAVSRATATQAQALTARHASLSAALSAVQPKVSDTAKAVISNLR